MLYFALQQDINLDTFPEWLTEHQVNRWVYAGDDSTWRVRAEFFIPRNIQRISLALELDELSWASRTQYLNLIGKLSNINNSPEWWGSELASKNPYTQLYTKICLLAACRSLIEKEIKSPTAIICSSPALYQELISFTEEKGLRYKKVPISRLNAIFSTGLFSILSGFEAAFRWLPPLPMIGNHFEPYRRLLDTRNDYRRSVLKWKNISEIPKFTEDKGILLFTWVDRRNFTQDGAYRDPHFGPLHFELKKRGYEIIFVPRILFSISYSEAVDRLLKTEEQFIFPEQLINSADVYLCDQRSKQFQPFFPEGISIGPLPILSLLKEQHERYRKTLSDTLLYEYFIQHLAEHNIKPSQIIHTCEGHSWEQILKWSVQRYLPKTKVIGFDNITFSRLVLSMFPAENEMHIRPIPDRIVTNGPMFYEVLKSEGWPLDIIRSGCALRHSYLWESADLNSIEKKKKTDPIKILAATSIGLGDSVELADKAAHAFGGDNYYEVLIKCHPMVDITQVKSFLGSQIHHKNIHFVTEPMDTLLPRVDVLLYTYTSICFEALRFGVFPICVRSENFLNLDLLDAAPDIRGIATTPEEIRVEVEKFLQMPSEEKMEYKKRSMIVLRQALAPVTDSCINSFII